jgi:hypothetical protein
MKVLNCLTSTNSINYSILDIIENCVFIYLLLFVGWSEVASVEKLLFKATINFILSKEHPGSQPHSH